MSTLLSAVLLFFRQDEAHG